MRKSWSKLKLCIPHGCSPKPQGKKRAEIQLGLSYTRSPPWILHEGETHVKTPPQLSFSQHLDPSSCGCETSEFVLLSIWDLWKARRLQIALAVSTKVYSGTGHNKEIHTSGPGKGNGKYKWKRSQSHERWEQLASRWVNADQTHPNFSPGHFFSFCLKRHMGFCCLFVCFLMFIHYF